MSNLKLPKDTTTPNHIAIIPDGNRRWARSRGLNTLYGHKAGFEAAVKVCRTARSWGIHTVTLWGFSTENWDRTEKEINYLMKLYEKLIKDFLDEARKNEVRIYHLGRKDRLPKFLMKKIEEAENETAKYKKFIMNICLDYGGHDDILRAVQNMIKDGVEAQNVTKELMESYIDTHSQPYPYADLMIRTSGEQRTSGFLLWESPYTEYYWENGHFPDFSPEKLKEAILDYSRRRRRFGGNDAVEHFTFDPHLVANLELKWWRLANIPQGVTLLDYSMQHVKEQFGLSKKLASQAAKYMLQAGLEFDKNKLDKAKVSLKKFYKLIKEELKLAFEPEIVATLEVEMRKQKGENEELEKEHLAEVYRISLFQAAKAAHLRVLANVARNRGDWGKAEDYLQKYYSALKERVA
ncbi:MAG: Isoprenyl transferase [Candidatus Woesebacteria bacterium GW2011_GWA1_33_30]|uniref:Isoprenyl transferase n=1 Tax=Candidatus Woesebacteria bacterium GW2011_GWA2_33_28 TaxID=1618561 RepID=A0A0F9ZRN1_9BACT|nr:MAG: Isoprenyl transferase [Candidatus Woesebacteria bacterium GW2011_GWA2_33_28]KKP47793.1 MAG: Isoprenyl transferase [Candidatus Woesebacteria bacterium GW2011_GWA1_33_30]KKP49238.1 MAG: Isoprenyl transferase [Microgenomates group bacterium GW2011_GWC1_33_32]KKP51605.1 MAG: Isoprenyl transferase [Candidatus Woesebacteria bacterium GW2011_GWB1_33_38]KKP56185.1 MAG: Isoprenyl transferase [Microgenomates group bacterium GW2011_GWD1_33_9]